MRGLKVGVVLVMVGAVFTACFLIFTLNYRYDMDHFGDELIKYTDTTRGYNRQVFVEYKGDEYQIRDGETMKLYGLITRGSIDRKWLIKKPKLPTKQVAVAEFGKEITVTLIKEKNNPNDDGCYLVYEKNNKNQTRYYYVEGYKTFQWLQEVLEDNKGKILRRKITLKARG